MYDSDLAGIKAAHRSISVFEQGYLDARILVLPEGYDPDEYLREHGPDDFLKAADLAVGMITFLIDSAVQQFGLTLEGKVKVVSALQEPLAAVQDSVARALHIKQLAERLDVDETAIMEKVRQMAGKPQAGRRAASDDILKAAADDGQRLEEQIVAIMLRYPEIIGEVVGRHLLDYFRDDQLKSIGQMISDQDPTRTKSVAEVISMIEAPHYRNLLTKLAIVEQHWDRQGCERLLVQFESHHRRHVAEDLQRRIEAAEKDNDMDLLGKLLMQKQRAARGLTNS